MLFSSLVFLFLFLPLTLLAYYAVFVPAACGLGAPRVWRHAGNFVLLVASLFFYAWGEFVLTTVMIAGILVSFVGALGVASARAAAVAQGRNPEGAGKVWLVVSTIAMLGMLTFFKYANFGVENYNLLVAALGLPKLQLGALQVALPLGISFYTFQALSYTIDV